MLFRIKRLSDGKYSTGNVKRKYHVGDYVGTMTFTKEGKVYASFGNLCRHLSNYSDSTLRNLYVGCTIEMYSVVNQYPDEFEWMFGSIAEFNNNRDVVNKYLKEQEKLSKVTLDSGQEG